MDKDLETNRKKTLLTDDLAGCKIRLKQLIDSFIAETWQNQVRLSKQIIELLTTIMKKQMKLSQMK